MCIYNVDNNSIFNRSFGKVMSARLQPKLKRESLFFLFSLLLNSKGESRTLLQIVFQKEGYPFGQ